MSSCPGLDLEDYLLWNYDLTADDCDEANFSLGLAQAMGNIRPRLHLTKEQFGVLVAMFEDLREQIEYKLSDYDEEDHGSWRDYAGYNFDFIPPERDTQALAYLAGFKGVT